jgi:hypothetical protein
MIREVSFNIVRGDDRWRIEGGRCGRVKYAEGDQRAELEYEMGGGDTSMIISGEHCQWTAPEARKMTPDEVRRLARELARGIGRIVIAYAARDLNETIDGRD